MSTQRVLEERLVKIEEVVQEFRREYPTPTIDEAPEDFYQRMLAVSRVRSYLAGQLANIHRIHSAAKIEVANATTVFEVEQIKVLPRMKMKDFDSGEVQKVRLRAEVLDQYLEMRKAEQVLEVAWKVLNFTRTHLEEFQRMAQDHKLWVETVYNG